MIFFVFVWFLNPTAQKNSLYQALLPTELKQVSSFFNERPKLLLYKQNEEYAKTGITGLSKYLLLSYHILESDNQISKRRYLKGDQKIGKAAIGGFTLYDYPYPFLENQIKKYQFFKQNNRIVFLPKNANDSLWIGHLDLKDGQPHKMIMTPTKKIFVIEYLYKEIIFQVIDDFVVEDFMTLQGAFQYLPGLSNESYYAVDRFDFVYKDVVWPYSRLGSR